MIPTYKSMADAAIKLMNACNEAKDKFDSDKEGAQAKIAEAGDYWKESRKYWELSEAFLFGAAADYNIDPHIDSWPLDKAALEQLLNNQGMMNAIGEGGGAYVSANLGYGLLGFHAIEYMLFQLNASGDHSSERDVNSLNKNQMIYMAAVAEDLCFQCVRLEASWAGMDNVSSEKQTILTDNELEPTFNYGESMLNAGQGGSKYVNSTLPTKWLNRRWDVLPTEVVKRTRTISNRHTVSTLLLTLRIISEASKMHTKAATTETSP